MKTYEKVGSDVNDEFNFGSIKVTRDLPDQAFDETKVSNHFLSTVFLTLSLATIDYFYITALRECTYNNQLQCISFFFLDDIGLWGIIERMFYISTAFAFITWLTVSNLIDRRWCFLVIFQTALVIYVMDGDHIITNFSHAYTRFFFYFFPFTFSFIYVVDFSFRQALKGGKKLAFFLLAALILYFFSTKIYQEYTIRPNKYWTTGVNDKKLLYTDVDGSSLCYPPIPKQDWKNLFDGWLSISNLIYDCTKDNELRDSYMIQLQKYYAEYRNQRYIVFPDLSELPKPFWRQQTQEFLLGGARYYKHESEIPQDAEYVLNTATLEYQIKINRIEKKVQARTQKFAELKKQIQNRVPPKNIIVIYIDSLSRVAMAKKLPKTFKWYSEYQSRHNDDSVLYQGMRFQSVATFTYHNILAYQYAACSASGNVYENSPFSLNDKASNFEWVNFINPRTGMTDKKKKLKGGLVYEALVNDLKSQGYMTAVASTDCAVSPLTQEELNIDSFLRPLRYDHTGIVPSCDPNFFNPEGRTYQGSGPYSILRRCVYGKELIDYAIEYGMKFLEAYKNEAKYFTLELIEAHENTQEVVTYADEKLLNFFNWLEKNQHLDDSILVFLSDHGYHMFNSWNQPDEKFQYDIGFPILIMLLKKSHLESQDLENLKRNEQTLTSMFELHFFFQYIANIEIDYSRKNSLVAHIAHNRTSEDLPDIEDRPPKCIMKSKH